MTLDLLTGPASGLNRACAILPVHSGLSHESSNPFLAEEVGKLAVRESISQITDMVSNVHFNRQVGLPKNAHRRPHQSFTAARILRNEVQELEDALHVRLELGNYKLC